MNKRTGDIIWAGVLIAVSLFLLFPASREAFIRLTQNHYYPMSFIKFAILATMGEMLAVRILNQSWQKPKGMLAKALIWGFLGMVIALTFGLYNGGAQAVMAAGLLPGSGAFMVAFYTSFLMNLTFGPIMMGSHRISDTYVDRRIDRAEPATVIGAIEAVDWVGFIKIAVLKTIPFFWIPAHTLVFLLPPEFRVLASAYLSIVLGAMMAYIKKQGQTK
ncbi:MAG: hypothetical protein LBV79_06385 [Candidatus Adiutrix sp.]|jgi:hypothetical protein|nr:hypothetical protein [Candidatus Adiutrix sp.]